ncbi:MAG: hypothetical protein S4CHLAM37_16880 [Chlamydiia bacterium]|nr:hypothetical protein [Chlamydiia bacterium]
MKKQIFTAGVICTSILACAGEFTPIQTDAEVKELLDFLVSSTDSVGFTYQGTVGELNNLTLPLSYYSTADYWGTYVGGLPGNDLTVTDVYNPGDYTLSPDMSTPGANLQVERVNTFYGTDIYDASCWQIALALCGKNSLTGPSGQDLFQLTANQDKLLFVGYDGNAPQPQANANRATTKPNGTFEYNGQSITNPSKAYFFRMVTRNWLSHDPFMGTEFLKHVTAENLPSNPVYQKGMITWLDWKPISGENAWGLFLGPLQASYLKQQKEGASYVPFSSDAVQNALGTLFGLRCMQSELGGIYYACKGSLGNVGDKPVNPFEVSVENNASALAGLLIFQTVLKDELAHETDLSAAEKQQVQTALSDIDAMINGGTTPQGTQTKGILAFFKENAWDATNGIFYQGGDANNPQKPSTWIPTVEPKAVDVNTWGISVLGQPLVDAWHGFGSCYKLWTNVKSWGGFYGPDKTIWGVGYSDEDDNGSSGDYKKGIISAEWTAGAINMVRCLITQYEEAAKDAKYTPAEQKLAQGYVTDLKKDHDSMFKNLMSLRSDHYPTSAAYDTVRPADYTTLIPIPSGKLAFVYASKRYMIPFGWFANPLPSTTSTSWSMMLHYNFNPFSPAGSYEATFAAPTAPVLGETPIVETPAAVKPTEEHLLSSAKEITSHFNTGFHWEDFFTMIHSSQNALKSFTLTNEEIAAHVKTILKHVIDLTDTPYLPDSLTDAAFKSMVDPFVDLVLPTHSLAFTMEMRDGFPDDLAARSLADKFILKLNSNFHWKNLSELVLYSLHAANSFTEGSKDERRSFAKKVIEITLAETDTVNYPDYFMDWVFQKLAFCVIDHSFDS